MGYGTLPKNSLDKNYTSYRIVQFYTFLVGIQITMVIIIINTNLKNENKKREKYICIHVH